MRTRDTLDRVTPDAVGNAYVMGTLMAKFRPDGAQQWLHDLPEGRGEAVAVNASGEPHFVGWTSEAWIEKRDVLGNLIWRTTLINPNNAIRANGVAVSPAGKVVVTGLWSLGPGEGQNPVAFLATYSALGVEESFTLQPFPFDSGWSSENKDVAKYDASGSRLWIDRFSGGTGYSGAWGVAANASADRVCATGWTAGELEGQSTANSSMDAYVVCYDTSGTRLYTRQFGTEETEHGEGIAMDAAGNVYAAGSTSGTFGSNLGGLLGGRWNAFLARYDSQGIQTHIWQFGTLENDFANGVAIVHTSLLVSVPRRSCP